VESINTLDWYKLVNSNQEMIMTQIIYFHQKFFPFSK
jgi:hypothetical protein